MSEASVPLFCDVALARQLELTEGHSNAAAVDARAAIDPQSGARWVEVAGALAMFDGVDSPLTQTFGLGMSGTPSDTEMDSIESFFRGHGAPVFHEVSPLAGPGMLEILHRRGYELFECTSVLVRPIDDAAEAPVGDGPQVRLVDDDGHESWADTSARGWSEYPELAGFMRDLGRITARRRDAHRFLAEIDGVPVAAGLLSMRNDIALLAGASTIPEWRRRGAQLALLHARLRYAAANGCTIAMMCALPGSGSQRNAERHGFRVVYTRLKWRLV
jgi:GNAT superfamily N-acetyltransferase